MPMERLAVVAAVQTARLGQNGGNGSSYTGYIFHGYNMSNGAGGRQGGYETNLHGNVNILLGGAMMSGVIIVVILICYCCHKNIRKNRPQEYSQYWRAEPDVHSLEVFTMDAHAMQCCERAVGTNLEEASVSLPCPSTPGPPPAYESLVFNPTSLPSPSGKKDEPSSPGYILPVPMQPDIGHRTKNEFPVKEDEDLPSYEAALKLEANGYV